MDRSLNDRAEMTLANKPNNFNGTNDAGTLYVGNFLQQLEGPLKKPEAQHFARNNPPL